jgi:hypothetical protein
MTPEVDAYLDKLPARRRHDAETLLELMGRVTGQEPRFSGMAAGFGTYHYRYASGREGDAAAAAFAARTGALVIYLMDGVGAHAELLARLGPHRTGVGCVYLRNLQEIDLDVLERIVSRSYATLTAGTYTHHARESGESGADVTDRGPERT